MNERQKLALMARLRRAETELAQVALEARYFDVPSRVASKIVKAHSATCDAIGRVVETPYEE